MARDARDPSLRREASFKVVGGDLLQRRGSLIPREADLVFHLAARSATTASLEDPAATFAVNAMGTARLLEEVRTRSLKLKRFVVASSSQVYGRPQQVPIPEDAATEALNPYAASKMAAEAYAMACHRLYATPVTVVRPFNVYGPDQKSSYVVPSVLAQCLSSKRLKIGNPWPVRDFLFVEDAVTLLERMGESSRAVGEAFNAGTGRGTSIVQMAKLAAKVTGSGLTPKVDAHRQRSSELDLLVADVRKARRLLGWSPRTTLAEGLRKTAEAMRTAGA
jgi:nucleoside-diphosphate-sugar epimerase